MLIGARYTVNGGTGRGSAYLYLGSATSLGTVAGTTAGTVQRFNDPANTDNDYYGYCVASAGDINGDGYADVVVGAYGTDNGGTDQGSAYFYRGNQGDARPGGNLRLYNTDLTTPLQAAANKPAAQFGIGLTTRSVQGRVRARLVWEVVANGASFLHASPITNSVQYTGRGPWTNLPLVGTELKQLVSKAGYTTRVRARLEYATASPLLAGTTTPANGTGGVGGAARYGPWQYVVAQQLATLNALPLPVELTAFTATAEGPAAVLLAWATASEKNSKAFEVERSLDGAVFERIGTVAAAGSSTTPLAYTLLDGQLPAGTATLYYRLRQVDAAGPAGYSPVRTVVLSPKAGLALYPNPAHAGATLTGAAPGTVVRVFDALGRVVATSPADATGTAALVLPAGLPAGVYVVRVGSKAGRLAVE